MLRAIIISSECIKTIHSREHENGIVGADKVPAIKQLGQSLEAGEYGTAIAL